ncbi:MAG: GGDEF domain-containing protein [Lachnospiraceae bacterium]|nr:GGDEF domain-containing protein [Lachnospiraceae bacterium]MCR4865700.1 bifunctional diguanylate cyclase/phosphodiesterase [Lachnospiraceae bacterium]
MNEDNSYQISLLSAMNTKLAKSEGILKNICDISESAFIYFDYEEKKPYVLGNWSHFFDFEPGKFLSVGQIVDLADDEFVEGIYRTLNLEKTGEEKSSFEFKMRDKNLYVNSNVNVLYDNAGIPVWKIIVFTDVTKYKNQNDELTYMAYYDSLTGLYNRNYFVLSLGEMVSKAEQNNAVVSILFIDVDDFRKVNDGMGILEGDEVVQSIGLSFKKMMDENLIISHFNSDIFCMAIYDPVGRRSVESIVDKIREIMRTPIKLVSGKEVTLTVSVGVAEYPESTNNYLELINLAEIVMLKAKNKGKNNVQYYDKPIIDEFIGNIEIEKKMSKALKNQNFVMYYQPQYDTNTRELRGVEALVRWCDEDGKLVSPETFIPIAEKNGSILLLGDWIIEECLSDLSRWKEKHNNMEDFLLSINVSSIQFKNKNFVKYLISIIKKYGISPTNVELEITESVFIDNMEEIIHKMKLLKDFGIRFSMDDFGTGFSSLSYLRELPIDTLKIDKSFIDDVVTDGSTRTIAESIIDLSKKLGFDTIAEGVEQEVQYSLLKNIGCENIQGFYLGKPMKFEEIDALLDKTDVKNS